MKKIWIAYSKDKIWALEHEGDYGTGVGLLEVQVNTYGDVTIRIVKVDD